MFTLRAGVISQDPTWENIGAAIWSCIELNISIIASTLPTLRPLIGRLLPGIGFSSARTARTAYLRYGSASAVVRPGTFKAADARAAKRHSTSIEELALKDLEPSPAGSIAAGVYAHASADPAGVTFPDDPHHGEGGIFKRTEISVRAGSRHGAR